MWKQKMQSTPMKCFMIFIGLLLSLFGYAVFLVAWTEMTSAPEPGYSVSDYAVILGLGGVLPLVCGLVLCFFAVRKWLKVWREKAKLLNTEIDKEKPVDPAIIVVNRRIKRRIIWSMSFWMVLGIILLILMWNWLGVDWWVEWPWYSLFLVIWLLVMGMMVPFGYKIALQMREGRR